IWLFSLKTEFPLSFRIRQRRVRPATAKKVSHVDLGKDRRPSCSVANRRPLVVVRFYLVDRLLLRGDVPSPSDFRHLRRLPFRVTLPISGSRWSPSRDLTTSPGSRRRSTHRICQSFRWNWLTCPPRPRRSTSACRTRPGPLRPCRGGSTATRLLDRSPPPPSSLLRLR
ncbi:unnamed protein product, partial [Ixodes pacificus]